MKRGFLSLMLSLLCITTVMAYDMEVNGVCYNITDAEAKTVEVAAKGGLLGYSGEIVIPASVSYEEVEYSVTAIGNKAFTNSVGMTSIEIPGSVITIPNGLFGGCAQLVSVVVDENNLVYDSRENCNAIIETASNTLVNGCKGTIIPNGITSIGERAFYTSSVTSIVIPNSVTTIGINAFQNCRTMTSIELSDNLETIEEEAFNGCQKLQSIVIPNTVTTIGKGAFNSCVAMTSVTLPENLVTIEDETFYMCRLLHSITIPSSVTSIGNSAFYECYTLTEITLPNALATIGNQAFYNCAEVTAITIPANVTAIGTKVFANCTKLAQMTVNEENTVYDSRNNCNAIIETATNTLAAGCMNTIIPEDVTTIGTGAFYQCKGLTQIALPEGITTIADDAFMYCTNMTKLTLPSTLETIGERGFYGCSGVTEMSSLATTPPTIAEYTFYNLPKIPVFVPDNCAEAYKSADYWSALSIFEDGDVLPTGTMIVIDGINYIITSDTEKTVKVTTGTTYTGDMTIPASVTHTYDNTTYQVTAIDNSAFSNCSGLTSVTLPEGVTSIGERAFYRCSGLTSITIPEAVTSIGERAFYYCSGLTEITIPDNVISIGFNSFTRCSNLSAITVSKDNTTYDSRNNCNAIIESATNRLIVGCKNTVVPDGVAVIANRAFQYCTGLTKVVLPEGVTTIEDEAFAYCSDLTEMSISGTVTSIGNEVFMDCESLKVLTLADGTETLTMGYNTEGWAGLFPGKGLFGPCPLQTLYVGRDLSYDTSDVAGYSPFYPNTTLESITIGSRVTTIADYAFYNCASVTEINSFATEVPVAGTNSFYNIDKAIPVSVPAESVEAYKVADYWKEFTNIQAYDKITTEEVYYLDCEEQELWNISAESKFQAIFTNEMTGYQATVAGEVKNSNVLFYLAEGNSYAATDGVENARYTHVEFRLMDGEEVANTTGALYYADADKPVYRLSTGEWIEKDHDTGIEETATEDAIIVCGHVITAAGDIYVYNTSGVMVAYGSDAIDLSNLQRGIYLIHAGGAVKKVVL